MSCGVVSRAVLFDFGGTLDADGVPWKERIARLYRAEGVALPPDRFDRAFYQADDALVGAVPITLPLRDTVFALVRGVARGLELSDVALSDRVAARFLSDALDKLRDNAPTLAELGTRYHLGIVSNFYGNLETVCAETGIRRFFGAIVDSARVGCKKPDPRIFRCAVEALGVQPGEATFVGDSPSRDMAGARAVGMPHIWLSAGPPSPEGPCCPGDQVCESVKALTGLLP